MDLRLDRRYLTEEILATFGMWGQKRFHRTSEAAGDIVGFYCLPKSGTIRLGTHGTKRGSIKDSLHFGEKIANITLTVDIDDMAKPGVSIPNQYFQLLKKVRNSERKLEEIGLFIKETLESEPSLRVILI